MKPQNILWLLVGWLGLAILLPGAPHPVQASAFAPILGDAPRLSLPDQPGGWNIVSGPAATSVLTPTIYLPYIHLDASGLSVDPQNRSESLSFYQQHYLTSENTNIAWTGNHANCTPGSTALEFRTAVLQRINYFRAMSGVPADVSLDAAYNAKAQAAALMMSRNGALSHSPPTTWICYTANGAEAAGSSDLALGADGPQAISLYMLDPGSNNTAAGHRRWILYPQTQEMGSGDIPSGEYYASNALWVFDSHMWETRPATRQPYVTWPPPGYVPYPLVYARWSFSYPQANFDGATVSMSSGGNNVPVTRYTPANGYGENTLVWIVNGMSDYASFAKPAADTAYSVTLQNVVIGGQSRSFSYTVTVFDPGT